MGLKRDADLIFRNLFDTMWAARILGWKQVGLAPILEEHYGVKLDKRWQRYNWGRRPFDPAALAYARLDTHYLLGLRDIQARELEERGRMEEAREVFDLVAAVPPAIRNFHADDFWRVKGAWDLHPRNRAILRDLYVYREAEARKRDWPPFKVMGDRTLVAIAQAKPHAIGQLAHLDGMTPLQIQRYGHGVIEAVEHGSSAPIPQPPPSSPPDYGALARYEKLRAWRKQVAAARGVDPDVVVSNATLMAIAQRARRPLRSVRDLEGIEGLGPWRLRTYGQDLLEALK